MRRLVSRDARASAESPQRTGFRISAAWMTKVDRERQLISYEGHAGPLYGFALGNWKKTEAGELNDSELSGLTIPADFYQVLLISGCDTYMVADSL